MQIIASIGGGSARPEPVHRVSRALATSRQGSRGQPDPRPAHSAELPVEDGDRGGQVLEQLRAENQRSGRRSLAEVPAPEPMPEPVDNRHLLEMQAATTDLVTLLANHAPPAEGRQRAAEASRQLRAMADGQTGELVDRTRQRRTALQRRAADAYLETAGLRPEARMP